MAIPFAPKARKEMTRAEWECAWVNGDIDREGRPTKGTEYDKIVDEIGYHKFVPQDSAYLGDSPVGAPEEYYIIKASCKPQAGACAGSVGGDDGRSFNLLGHWDMSCPMFVQ